MRTDSELDDALAHAKTSPVHFELFCEVLKLTPNDDDLNRAEVSDAFVWGLENHKTFAKAAFTLIHLIENPPASGITTLIKNTILSFICTGVHVKAIAMCVNLLEDEHATYKEVALALTKRHRAQIQTPVHKQYNKLLRLWAVYGNVNLLVPLMRPLFESKNSVLIWICACLTPSDIHKDFAKEILDDFDYFWKTPYSILDKVAQSLEDLVGFDLKRNEKIIIALRHSIEHKATIRATLNMQD
jgi:hypothetical protein